MRQFALGLALITASLFISVILLEAGLHLVPVNEGLHTQPVDQSDPILRFEQNRTATWSRFANFSMVNTIHSNNYGFINNQDYTPAPSQPLIAVIGDSYVEAAMVPYDQTLHGRLARSLDPDIKVYSFGASGAPLSQYLAYAGYAKNEFHPQKMIFIIVGNDFDESILSPSSSPGFHYFKDTNHAPLELTRIDFHPSIITSLVRRSKLAMYLATNLQAQHALANLKSLFSNAKPKQFVGQTKADVAPKRLASSRQAIQRFFELLPEMSGLAPQDILFVVDGLRPHLYSQNTLKQAKKSYFAHMRKVFLGDAKRHGYMVADLQPVFQAAHKMTGKRFEFKKDGHWNAEGHRLAAQEALASPLLAPLR